MNISQITHLTLRWLESADNGAGSAAVDDLVKNLESAGNTQAQVDHWIGYAGELTALEGETLAAVIETEACLARMQGRIR